MTKGTTYASLRQPCSQLSFITSRRKRWLGQNLIH
jgi:hypothetical protein